MSTLSAKTREMSNLTHINGVIRRLGLLVALAAIVAALLAPGAQAVACPQSVALAPTMQDCATIGQLKEPSGFATARVTPAATGDGFEWADAGLGAAHHLARARIPLFERLAVRIEQHRESAIRPSFEYLWLDGVLGAQDTAAVTGRSIEGLPNGARGASWARAAGKRIDDA